MRCVSSVEPELAWCFEHPGMSFNPIRKIGVQFFEALNAHRTFDKDEARKRILKILGELRLTDGKRIFR